MHWVPTIGVGHHGSNIVEKNYGIQELNSFRKQGRHIISCKPIIAFVIWAG
jgi:hypothetical protein